MASNTKLGRELLPEIAEANNGILVLVKAAMHGIRKT